MTKTESPFCWWKQGVFYHIYPQSYKDTSQNGTGDLQGIIRKLDYLVKLGVDAIWLSPIYKSPLIDGGYDIKDYRSINPLYGSFKDFNELVNKLHQAGIKIIMDMVFNHTSCEHPWFIQSRSSPNNPKRDWYIWRSTANNKKPNNWITNFGQSAWTLDSQTKEYYYHSFFNDQPDLNWRNPEVKKEMQNVLKYWLELGVDGFRFDVINMLFKHPEFKNKNPLKLFFANRNVPNRNQPEVYKELKEIRSLLNTYQKKVCIGEIYTPPPGDSELVSSFLGNKDDMLHLAFDFSLIYTRFNARRVYKTLCHYYQALPASAWPSLVLSNHDLGRNTKPYHLSSRLRQEKAKVLATLLLTLRGTPFIYYGDEIGMENASIPRKELKDRYGKLFYPFYKGRDKARTPMQWNNTEYAGFSNVKPWLPVHKSYKRTNVAQEEKNKNSLLNLYRTLIRIRKQNIAFQLGSIHFLNKGESGLLVYQRVYKKEAFTIILNFSNFSKRVPIPFKVNKSNLLFSTFKIKEINENEIKIKPFGVLIFR